MTKLSACSGSAATYCCALTAIMLFWGAPAPASEVRGMTALDLVELPRIGDPSLSPDGSRVIYLRSEVDWHENKQVKRLRLMQSPARESTNVIEPAKPTESFSKTVWLPQGDGLLTTLKRDDDEHEQAYQFDLAAQSLTRLTQHPTKVDDVVVAADGNGFFFSAKADAKLPKIGESNGAWSISEYESDSNHELWYTDLSSRESHKLLAGEFDVRSYGVSRDGRKVLYVRGASALTDEQDRELWIYDIDTGRTEQITDNSFVESKAVLAPDNSRVAYIATVNGRGEPYYEDNIFVQEIGAEKRRLILPRAKMEMLDVDWDAAGTGLYFLGNTGLRTHLYHFDLKTSTLLDLTPGDHVIDDWRYDAALDAHLFLKVSANNPGEIWVLETGRSSARQLSFEHADLENRFRLPQQTAFTWRGRGSVMLEGLLVYPLDYQPGMRVPLVTITHGGPRSSSQFGSWNMSRAVPVLAAEGYAVFLPNHRGGTGYGDKFMRDMVGNYFNNSHHDVLDGIDALIEAGITDGDQLIKMGWSAGGHMTNKMITFTERFRAASSGAGAAFWVSMYAESDVRANREPWFGGAPWTRRAPLKSYIRQSPLKDAWRIKTPTLFFVGSRDVRVPPTQSIMMYRAAKAAGAKAELYVAPGEKHQFGLPAHRLFKINKDLEWFAMHLGRPPYEPVYPLAKDEPLAKTEAEEELKE